MNNQYFFRIYFSRYFYSSFKSTLKTRIKITRNDDAYFYSDPYFFNFKQKNSLPIAIRAAPYRSYFFPVYFSLHPFGQRYDLSWQKFVLESSFLSKFFPIYLKLRVFNPLQLNFIKIYFNFFAKHTRSW